MRHRFFYVLNIFCLFIHQLMISAGVLDQQRWLVGLRIWVLQSDVLSEGAFRPIWFSALFAWTSVLSLNFFGAASESFLFLLLFVSCLSFFGGGDELQEYFFFLKGGRQLGGNNGVGVEKFGNFLVIEREGLIVISLEWLDFDGGMEWWGRWGQGLG